MAQATQFSCKAGFLPSVKIKPLSNFRNRKAFGDRFGLYCRTKLKITEEEKNVPDLIEQYYKRFKLQSHKSEPLSVSINFKQISQEQLEETMAKSKEEKLRVKSSKNKNRNNSEGSYSLKLKEKKISEAEKIKLSTKMILHRLKSFPNSQICRDEFFKKNLSEQISQKEDEEHEGFNHVSRTLQIGQSKSKKYFVPKGESKIKIQSHKSKMSTIFALSSHKKSKEQCKTLQKLNKFVFEPQKVPSPWQEELRDSHYNPESLDLLQNSVQQ